MSLDSLEDVCRLCLSQQLVNNVIFDEDNKIYVKILSCLPVQVKRDDLLPKRICDFCSCKVDDFYQFCHRAIDSENRLLLLANTQSNNADPTATVNFGTDDKIYQFTSSFLQFHKNGFNSVNNATSEKTKQTSEGKTFVTSSSQTDELFNRPLIHNIKLEPNLNDDDDAFDHYDDVLFADDDEEKERTIKKEIFIPLTKKTDKNNSTHTIINKLSFTSSGGSKTKKSSKNHSTNNSKKVKVKKEKSLKVKIKKLKRKSNKFVIASNSKSDSEDDDNVSLVDMIKKKNNKHLKIGEDVESIEHATMVLEMKDIKTELVEDVPDLGSQQQQPEWKVKSDSLNLRPEEWNCCICFMKCYDREEMQGHYRSHNCVKDVQEVDTIVPQMILNENGESIEIFICPHCNSKSETKGEHERHIKGHGLDKPYQCSLCEKTFRHTSEILKHGKNAHRYDIELQETKLEGDEMAMGGGGAPMRAIKRFMCDLCDETFVYMKYVQIHRNLQHPEAKGKQFVNRCLHCHREFAHLNSLRRHLRSHSGERNFLCYICGKSLSSREHLKFHIRIHTGFKPHICKTCGKGFVKKCNLTLHERVHSGEKPHVCSHCGKAFSQRSTLVIHERYHSGSRPYVCSICNKGFVAKGLLSMHLKTSCI